jgi:hypothetical protein
MSPFVSASDNDMPPITPALVSDGKRNKSNGINKKPPPAPTRLPNDAAIIPAINRIARLISISLVPPLDTSTSYLNHLAKQVYAGHFWWVNFSRCEGLGVFLKWTGMCRVLYNAPAAEFLKYALLQWFV